MMSFIDQKMPTIKFKKNKKRPKKPQKTNEKNPTKNLAPSDLFFSSNKTFGPLVGWSLGLQNNMISADISL